MTSVRLSRKSFFKKDVTINSRERSFYLVCMIWKKNELNRIVNHANEI